MRLAYRWHMLAAHAGHTESQHFLGTMYSSGMGTAKRKD